MISRIPKKIFTLIATQQLRLRWREMPQFQQALGSAPARRLHPFQRILGASTGFGAHAPHPSGQILDPRPWSMESTASGQDFMEQLLFGRIQLAGLEGVMKTGTKKKCWWCTSLSLSLYTYGHQYYTVWYVINYRFFLLLTPGITSFLCFIVKLFVLPLLCPPIIPN